METHDISRFRQSSRIASDISVDLENELELRSIQDKRENQEAEKEKNEFEKLRKLEKPELN